MGWIPIGCGKGKKISSLGAALNRRHGSFGAGPRFLKPVDLTGPAGWPPVGNTPQMEEIATAGSRAMTAKSLLLPPKDTEDEPEVPVTL